MADATLTLSLAVASRNSSDLFWRRLFFQTGDGGDGVAFFGKAHENHSLGIAAQIGDIFEGELDDLGLAGSENDLIDGFIDRNAADNLAGFGGNGGGFDALAAPFLQGPTFDSGSLAQA